MSLYFPEDTTAQGNIKIVHVPAYAAPAAPKMTEVGATGALDLSCFLLEGSAVPTVEANKGTAPRRVCSREQFERFGNKVTSITDLMYVVDPQAALTTEANKAYATLTEGVKALITFRPGRDARETPLAIGHFVFSFSVEYGPQNETWDTSDEFAVIHVVQPVVVRAAKYPRAALVA